MHDTIRRDYLTGPRAVMRQDFCFVSSGARRWEQHLDGGKVERSSERDLRAVSTQVADSYVNPVAMAEGED